MIGIRIVQPTRRGLIERLGKYHHFANSGIHWIIPIVDKLYQVNITEQLVNVIGDLAGIVPHNGKADSGMHQQN